MIIPLLKKHTVDAVLYFAGEALNPMGPVLDADGTEMKNPDGSPAMSIKDLSPGETQEAVDQIVTWLAMIPGDVMRDGYVDTIYKHNKNKIGKKGNITNLLKKKLGNVDAARTGERIENADKLAERLPAGIDAKAVLQNGGWYQMDGSTLEPAGIYFIVNMNGDPVPVSNFSIEPLFHKVDVDDNSRIIKINDGTTEQIIEMPSSALLGRDSFRKFLFDKGAYHFEGTGAQLDKITKQIMRKFPKAWELKELGWQPEGFFAYYNYSFNGELKEYDKAGLVEHAGKFFYSPAVSGAYNDEREGNDQFENDRYLQYIEPPITFEEWCQRVHAVYGEHSMGMIGCALLALHRDIHFKIDNNCPHLYMYGESGSGKSKAAETVSNLFFKELPAYALSSGTDFAFAKRMGRYRNTPIIMNEFDISMIKEERFNQLKNAYDGEGREKGSGGSKNKTTTEKVESLLILCGQFLVTNDDNSIVNRSILQKYTKLRRTEAQMKAYEELKALEKRGLGGVPTELMPYRKEVSDKYYTIFHDVMRRMGGDIRQQDVQYHERVLRNYSSIPALIEIFSTWVSFPWSNDDVYQWAMGEVIKLSNMISKSDVLMKFWMVLESLVMDGQLRHGRHYMVDQLQSVQCIGDNAPRSLGDPRDLLMIRLRPVHQLYMKQCRTTGERPIDITSLENYLGDKEYLIGRKDHRFTEIGQMNAEGARKKKSNVAKAWVIDLEKAGLGKSAFMQEVEYEDGMSTSAEATAGEVDDMSTSAKASVDEGLGAPEETQGGLAF